MLNFKVFNGIKKCQSLWNKFSPNNVLWDLWDFRYCFHNQNFEFYFIVGLENNNEVGLVPLVYDKKNKIYTYFGDTFPEQNKFFLKDKNKLNAFLEKCPEGTSIYYISKSEMEFYNFDAGEKRYFIDFKKHNKDIENYLKTFTKKHRKNLRYDLKKLKEKGYEIEINRIEDFEILVELNKQKFGKDSDYNDRDFVKSIKRLIEAAQKMQTLHMISIKFNNKTEAVGLGVIYNKTYHVISNSRNVEIKNLGKLLIFEQIRSALGKNCDEIDFLSSEAGWKDLWNLDSEQMYEFLK